MFSCFHAPSEPFHTPGRAGRELFDKRIYRES
jgi:hypothetical protein